MHELNTSPTAQRDENIMLLTLEARKAKMDSTGVMAWVFLFAVSKCSAEVVCVVVAIKSPDFFQFPSSPGQFLRFRVMACADFAVTEDSTK